MPMIEAAPTRNFLRKDFHFFRGPKMLFERKKVKSTKSFLFFFSLLILMVFRGTLGAWGDNALTISKFLADRIEVEPTYGVATPIIAFFKFTFLSYIIDYY